MAAARSRFVDKTVIVTGGANGIGRGISLAFLAEGAFVAVFDRDAKAISSMAAQLSADESARCVMLDCDVSNESSVEQSIGTVIAQRGGVDILVNNAAAFVYGTVDSVTSEAWDKVLGTNVKGYAFMMKYSIPSMKQRGGGAIVNISSISAFCGQEDFVPYSTTKAAVLQMTRNVAMDVGKHGIRVNAVCPGPILTDATSKHAAGLGKTLAEVVSELTGHLILKRMGSPNEVAKAVLFLASEDASFTTGSHVMVDGGYLLR